jgi:glucose-1-phosphate thymidylyltransferase
MKGIVLAGGLGTRLLPTTKVVNKHLLLLYDKPIIYYSISTLMLSGIREICLITKPEDVRTFRKLLGNGSDFGIEITYKVQVKPKGIGEAFLLTKSFIKDSNCALILGDNIFFGVGLGNQLSEKKEIIGAQIFGYRVKDARNYGV